MKYLVLTVFLIIFLIDLYFTVVSLGYRKKYCAKCKGYLLNTQQRRDVYIGGATGRFYKHYLDYKYTYKINGKTYEISDGTPGTKKNIPYCVDIIYQKKNPKFAYIKNLTIPFEPVIAFILLPLWIMFLIICIAL